MYVCLKFSLSLEWNFTLSPLIFTYLYETFWFYYWWKVLVPMTSFLLLENLVWLLCLLLWPVFISLESWAKIIVIHAFHCLSSITWEDVPGPLNKFCKGWKAARVKEVHLLKCNTSQLSIGCLDSLDTMRLVPDRISPTMSDPYLEHPRVSVWLQKSCLNGIDSFLHCLVLLCTSKAKWYFYNHHCLHSDASSR